MACSYQPRVIGLLRAVRDRAVRDRDEEPSDGYDLADLLAGNGDAVDRGRWAAIVADLARAEAAGCTTDDEISAFLCPVARSARG